MMLDDLRELCFSLPGVSEGIKWENHLCFMVGEKMFLITGLDEIPMTATFKCSEESFDEFIAREGFSPAPYLARNKWVAVDNINRLDKTGWKKVISVSYQLIFSKLPAKTRKEISVNQPIK